MKIAITGHKKGIGKAFADQLSARGHEIVGISRSDGENIRRTAHIDINGLTMRESMQYRNQKMALELAHHQLNFQPSNTKMELIRPGNVRTQSFSAPTAITAEEYVKQVLAQQSML